MTGRPATPTNTAHGQIYLHGLGTIIINVHAGGLPRRKAARHLTASTRHTIGQTARRLAKSNRLHQDRTVASLEQTTDSALSSQTAPTLVTYLIATLSEVQVSLSLRN